MGSFTVRNDYGTCTQCVRFTFIGCNVFFAFLSLLGFILGIWSIASAAGYSSQAGGAILLVSSIISFGLCVAGIIGAVFMLRPFLIVYAIVLGIVVVLEFASAISSFVLAGVARDAVKTYFEDAIEDYRVDPQDPEFDRDNNDQVESIQDAVKCCGINNATDWIRLNSEAVRDNGLIPPNCTCNPNEEEDDTCTPFVFQSAVTGSVWKEGCLDTLEIFLRAYYVVIGVISLIIMAIEILFVVVAICLTITITRAVRSGGLPSKTV